MPLRGVRVLDLSRLAPGPYATRLLAELGADVVKVEDPSGGDYTRWAPPLDGDPPTSGLFRELNAGKRSVVLDLKRPEAKSAFRLLVARSDVLVDGFRPGVLARLDLDPKALMERHPRLIYCAVTGFGLTGPDAPRAGHDIGYMARAGALGLSGPEERPLTLGVQVADVGGALVAALGVLAALRRRDQTGVGSVVDVSLAEAALAFNALNFGALHAGAIPRRGDEILDGSRPCYSVYRTQDDRFLAVGALEPKFWSLFVEAIGLPELRDAGLDHGEAGRAAKEKVEARVRQKTRDEWTALFRSVDCCVEPVLGMDEVERDPHHVARRVTSGGGFVRGPVRVGSWSELALEAHPLPPAPVLGADTRDVLMDAGLDEAAIRALVQG